MNLRCLMMLTTMLNKTRRRKRGIALVVVLALLAMMVLLAVAFAISMRTERTASRDYVEMIKARQRVHNIATALVMGREDEMTITKSQNEFYRSSYFVSKAIYGTPCYNFSNAPLDSIRDHIPLNVNQQLFNDLNSGVVQWVGTNQNGRLTERHAYAWFDCSDFLDAHTVSNATRGTGVYPSDVRIPTEVAGTLPLLRAGRRFESIGEISRYLPAARSLVPFSYIPVDQYWEGSIGSVSNRVYIGTNAASIQSAQTEIKNVVNSLGLDTSFYDNLYDFANSTTEVPSDPNQMGGGKLVPMLYQIAVTNGLRQVIIAGKKVWEVETRIIYETWFPYVVTDNKNFAISLTTPPTVTPPTTTPVAPGWALVTNGWQTTPIAITPSSPIISTRTNSFWTNTYVLVYQNNTFTDLISSAVSTLSWPSKAYVASGAMNGSRVDEATFGTFNHTFPQAYPNVSVPAAGWGVNDPRINHRGGIDWQKNGATTLSAMLGKTNEFCDTSGFKNDKYGDGSTFMYAPRSGNPGLKSIGDVGYLLYDVDKPWHTVRLMGPNAADPRHTRKLFDMLTIIPTNKVYQGFVNPNSEDTNALMCAFWDALKEKYPGELNAQRISESEARKIAARMIALGRKSGLANAYTNISDVCRLTTNDLANAVTIARDKDYWVQKSIMRNSLGLLNPRQNLWCAIIFAQSVKCNVDGSAPDGRFDPVRGDFVAGEAGAIMLVWRDPYETPVDPTKPNGLKTHKCFIRFFKWL